jgi:hypothetical protein
VRKRCKSRRQTRICADGLRAYKDRAASTVRAYALELRCACLWGSVKLHALRSDSPPVRLEPGTGPKGALRFRSETIWMMLLALSNTVSAAVMQANTVMTGCEGGSYLSVRARESVADLAPRGVAFAGRDGFAPW